MRGAPFLEDFCVLAHPQRHARRPCSYDDGDLEASLAQLGQVAGRVDDVVDVATLLARTVTELEDAAASLSSFVRVAVRG